MYTVYISWSLLFFSFSSLCRQVMTDENRDPKVFEITDTSSYLVLTLTGQSDIDLAIVSDKIF